MSTKNLRTTSLPPSSAASSSSLAKRNASSLSSSEIHRGKAPTLARKRPPLSNITNLKNVRHPDSASSRNIPARPATHLVPSSAKAAKPNKDSSVGNRNAPLNLKPSNINPPRKATPAPAPLVVGVRKDETIASRTSSIPPPTLELEVSPARSDSLSVSMDETMSTCDSFKSPDVEYVDNTDDSASVSIERKSFTNLSISEPKETSGRICSRNVVADMETDEDIVDVDYNFNDPQLCATIAGDIYKHLRATELKKRPSTDYMEKVQKDVIPSMRAILIDWLVEVAEEYRLMPDTLYLTVNYVDRYLSGNPMDRQRLQLLGIACMMIASKYEEICAPQVEEFCYITDNTYFRDEVLEMESSVLNYLKFEMTAPTAKCFLRRFARAAQGNNEVPSLQLEFLASYIAELSLVEYNMLFYAPSLVAASSIFLAKYILFPSKRPWTPTLQRYTLYEPADLQDCVKALHQLCWKSHISSLPAIREKYSQHKYKFVAKRYCPSSIPPECFHNLSK